MSARLTSGSAGSGRPRGTSPSSATPRCVEVQQPRGDDAADDDEERHRAVLQDALAEQQQRPARATPERERRRIGAAEAAEEMAMRSQKSPWLPLKPNSLGSCVLARNSATPHLKPTSTVSEKKLTTVPARSS